MQGLSFSCSFVTRTRVNPLLGFLSLFSARIATKRAPKGAMQERFGLEGFAEHGTAFVLALRACYARPLVLLFLRHTNQSEPSPRVPIPLLGSYCNKKSPKGGYAKEIRDRGICRALHLRLCSPYGLAMQGLSFSCSFVTRTRVNPLLGFLSLFSVHIATKRAPKGALFVAEEREGFEPSVPVRRLRFSRPSQSTTLASLHWEQRM